MASDLGCCFNRVESTSPRESCTNETTTIRTDGDCVVSKTRHDKTTTTTTTHVTQSQDVEKMLDTLLSVSYGLSMTSCTRLESFSDDIYHVTVCLSRGQGYDNNYNGNSICTGVNNNDNNNVNNNGNNNDTDEANGEPMFPDGCVLRMYSSKQSHEPQRMEGIEAVMQHARKKGIRTQTTVMNLEGHSTSRWILVNQDKEEFHVVCLRTFIPGHALDYVPWTPAMLVNLGVLVAKVTEALEDFYHPFFDTFNFSWSVESVKNLRGLVHLIDDEAKRTLVSRALDTLPNDLGTSLPNVTKRQVHGDILASNIVVQNLNDLENSDTVNAWALIDFHDTHVTFPLAELSTSACHFFDLNIQECARLSPFPPLPLSNSSPPLPNSCPSSPFQPQPQTHLHHHHPNPSPIISLPSPLRPFVPPLPFSRLEAACFIISGYNSILPISVKDEEFLFSGMKARLCHMVLHGQEACLLMNPTSDNSYIITRMDSAFRLLEDIETSLEDFNHLWRRLDTK